MSKHAFNRFYKILEDNFRHIRQEAVQFRIIGYELTRDGGSWSVNTPFTLRKDTNIFEASSVLEGRWDVFKVNYSARAALRNLLVEVYDLPQRQFKEGTYTHSIELLTDDLICFARVEATLSEPFKVFDGACSRRLVVETNPIYKVQRFFNKMHQWLDTDIMSTDRIEAEEAAIALLDDDEQWDPLETLRRTQILF